MKQGLDKMRGLLLAALLMLPMAVWAEAGKVMFVFGQAWVDGGEGVEQPVSKGMAFESGATFRTASNGRVQLRMADGGLIALKPSTEFQIESFAYAANQADTGQVAEPDRSFFGLVKGGFRSITGAVGQQDKSAYRVRTPVATIGIRGTDYDAVYCEAACEHGEAGLYVGVTEGGVVLSNDVGSIDLAPGQYGYVASEDSMPELDPDGAEAIASYSGSPAADEGEEEQEQVSVATTATDDSGQQVNLTDGDDVLANQSGQIGFAAGPLATADQFSGANSGIDASLGVTGSGDLVQFAGDFPLDNQGTTVAAVYDVGNAQTFDRGEDAATGIRWGRWAQGTINVVENGGTTNNVPLGNSSLHWVTGAVGEATPVLPTTGSASFTLVGNTNPTDNQGNVGTLGSASLSADFTRQTVDADVSLSMDANNEIWNASAQDVPIDQAEATFEGGFDTVNVTDTVSGSVTQGDGSMSGFFTGDEAGNVSGAGLGYSLDDGQGTSVTGAAAFRNDNGN